MPTATNGAIRHSATARTYQASCTSDTKAKLVYNGVVTQGSDTGPKWTLTADAGGSTQPENTQAINGSYGVGFLVDSTGTDKIAVEQEPNR